VVAMPVLRWIVCVLPDGGAIYEILVSAANTLVRPYVPIFADESVEDVLGVVDECAGVHGTGAVGGVVQCASGVGVTEHIDACASLGVELLVDAHVVGVLSQGRGPPPRESPGLLRWAGSLYRLYCIHVVGLCIGRYEYQYLQRFTQTAWCQVGRWAIGSQSIGQSTALGHRQQNATHMQHMQLYSYLG
jgi:hypothetical protein